MKNITDIAMILLGVLAAVALVGGVVLCPVFIAWLLYTHAVAPLFHWPTLGFWKCFGILWFFSIVINFIRPRNRKA